VEQVNWYDATEFCARLSAHTGRTYRLPTEAEWEYTCRAKPIRIFDTPEALQIKLFEDSTPFYFGNTLTTEVANYDGNYTYNNGPKGEYREETTSVDHFGVANAFGLSDMHGNVWEWCQDHWHSNYDGAPTDGSAWLSDYEKASRILRGGSWSDDPGACRSANRDNDEPGGVINDVGFRVCCPVPRT
jgi:formylglycine-generating enzyme required for sulfatase activity